ncbi:uncharacterized protein N7487_009435 [Penicillium crustosum]|uniref:uncharacterized protein n=1 Tax=Penicillium crustosum TaxID=36656 RepID=UPI00239FA4C4|nr:uncharacterized protein N7487_009435 [Penicillium crustosum]KAJ5395132.1 hypothetical protein N7487_009435 [Penicillium crustosum]
MRIPTTPKSPDIHPQPGFRMRQQNLSIDHQTEEPSAPPSQTPQADPTSGVTSASPSPIGDGSTEDIRLAMMSPTGALDASAREQHLSHGWESQIQYQKIPATIHSQAEGLNAAYPTNDWSQRFVNALDRSPCYDLHEPSSHDDTPEFLSFFRTDEQLPLTAAEILIFRNYVETVSRWIDSFSEDRPFYSDVPIMALRCPVLMNSCLALSAKQLALKSSDEEMATREKVAVKYHQKAIKAISSILADSACAWHDEILASSVILSTPIVDQSRGVYGNATGIKGAAYWTWYRHEIWAALQTGQQMTLNESYWRPEDVDSFENLSIEEISNRAIFLLGQCVSFCNTKKVTEGMTHLDRTEQEKRLAALQHALEEWKEKLPATSSYCLSESASFPHTSSSYSFPSIWFLYPQSAVAYQVYHASKILLNLHFESTTFQNNLAEGPSVLRKPYKNYGLIELSEHKSDRELHNAYSHAKVETEVYIPQRAGLWL